MTGERVVTVPVFLGRERWQQLVAEYQASGLSARRFAQPRGSAFDLNIQRVDNSAS